MNIDNTPTQRKFEPLLKAAEVARLLNVSRTQAYRLMTTELPAVRFGGNTVRVRLVDLEKYIIQHAKGGKNE